MQPKSGYAALRRYRWSAPAVDYFVTANAQRPTDVLGSPAVITAIQQTIARLETDGMWTMRCSVAMPDHVHLVFTLQQSGDLGSCLRLFKGRLAPVLRSVGARWQDGFFEHRVRPDEDRLPLFLYVFLNPYRANLVNGNGKWPGYSCAEEDWAWFEPLTSSGGPFPAWLA